MNCFLFFSFFQRCNQQSFFLSSASELRQICLLFICRATQTKQYEMFALPLTLSSFDEYNEFTRWSIDSTTNRYPSIHFTSNFQSILSRTLSLTRCILPLSHPLSEQHIQFSFFFTYAWKTWNMKHGEYDKIHWICLCIFTPCLYDVPLNFEQMLQFQPYGLRVMVFATHIHAHTHTHCQDYHNGNDDKVFKTFKHFFRTFLY